MSQRNDPARMKAARAWSEFVEANRERFDAAGLPALAARSIAHWDDLVANGSFRSHSDPEGFTLAALTAEQHAVFVGLVESYFAAGYEYFEPGSLKDEDRVRLGSRFRR